MNKLDAAYQSSRINMMESARNAAEQLWENRSWGDDENTISRLVSLVEGGITQTVHLINAYYTQLARVSAKDVGLEVPTLDSKNYTIESVRGTPASEVYSRPFGVLGEKLAGGSPFITADKETAKYVGKLVVTDLELAQTVAARDWMNDG